jgi:uncharacterized protein YndB with AHSA1/START domain
MLMQSEPTVPTVKIKRVISSDAHKIFNLWTRPELMAHWMSPYPGKVQCAAEADVRVGGTFKLSMQSDHSTCEIEGQYVVVDPPPHVDSSRLVRPADAKRQHARDRGIGNP